MQHDHVLKKLNFDILTLWVKGEGEESAGYQVAAFGIPFNLICNMTMFCKS